MLRAGFLSRPVRTEKAWQHEIIWWLSDMNIDTEGNHSKNNWLHLTICMFYQTDRPVFLLPKITARIELLIVLSDKLHRVIFCNIRVCELWCKALQNNQLLSLLHAHIERSSFTRDIPLLQRLDQGVKLREPLDAKYPCSAFVEDLVGDAPLDNLLGEVQAYRATQDAISLSTCLTSLRELARIIIVHFQSHSQSKF